MNARLKRISIASAAALLAIGLAGAASAAAPSLCNADGKVEVLSHLSRVSCDSSAKGEVQALLDARARYQADGTLAWQERALIAARIDRRIRDLRREIRRSRG